MSELEIRLAGAGELPLVHRLMLSGFAPYASYQNPSSALAESLADVKRGAASGGAILVFEAGNPVGSARFGVEWARPPPFEPARAIAHAAAGTVLAGSPGGRLQFSRMALVPEACGRGIGQKLVTWIELLASRLGLERVCITVRSQQPDNRPYYSRLGYRVTGYAERYGISNMVTYMEKPVGGK